jgi:hypothetical protein
MMMMMMIKETQWKWNLRNQTEYITKMKTETYQKINTRGNSFGFLRNFLCVSNDK